MYVLLYLHGSQIQYAFSRLSALLKENMGKK